MYQPYKNVSNNPSRKALKLNHLKPGRNMDQAGYMAYAGNTRSKITQIVKVKARNNPKLIPTVNIDSLAVCEV